MAAIDSLIEFLMSMLRDEETKTAFERDPQGTLARHGMPDVSEQDVRDARLIMNDGGGARDVVREIHHTRHIESRDVDQTFNLLDVDDRDTTIVNDSFNSDTDVLAIQDNSQDIDITDSFNKDTPPEESTEDPEVVIDDPVAGEPAEEPAVVIDDPVAAQPIEEPQGVIDDPVEDVEDEPELDPVESVVG